MKKLLHKAINAFGFQVSRLPKPQPPQAHKQPVYAKYFVREEEGLALYETPIGNYFVPAGINTDVVINHMRSGDYFDLPIIEVAKEYIKPNSAVLDVGANFGQMSVLFSQLVGKNGKVYAFDADDFVFEVLKKNIKANKADNVICTFGAVHELQNQIFIFPKQDFKRFGAYGSYGIDPNAKEGREVPSLTIDSLNIETPISFMKVDIQGSDLAAMRGAKQTILKNKMPIIFEFEQQFQADFGTCFQDYVEFVNEIGYRFERVVMDINYLIVPKD